MWTKAAEKFELLGHYKGGKEWLMPYLTVADFLLAELSYYVKKMYPESYGQFGFLQETRNSFNSIP